MFRPSSAFCKSLWCRAGCPKNSVALGAGVGLLDGSLRKWRSIKTPRPHPKAPRASHTPWYGEHRQGCAGTTLAARAPPLLLALLMFLPYCEVSLVGSSLVLRRGFLKNTAVDSRIGALQRLCRWSRSCLCKQACQAATHDEALLLRGESDRREHDLRRRRQ